MSLGRVVVILGCVFGDIKLWSDLDILKFDSSFAMLGFEFFPLEIKWFGVHEPSIESWSLNVILGIEVVAKGVSGGSLIPNADGI